ncbi:hypothetical protein [Paenibacillus apiarius]|uniref:Uncharacterized protein n=1 Tax=Paenibacillus apiarius TaxID=46240 RepID=A0ABT4E3N6_9BACL|nr:hypothetical protein [Paenibacillus apiarius]MCY9517871.1 hypothetical protein [Paenibacillus apiarius]MCY9523128.1 hypothetical protein [Paenibacillus apiarius]MCY9553918.1 hypothetical protein [Paenibacillus apiarius]MCY9559942.1 hypothetical protein [Paenibacillus apiarius]MCY9686413.1 hypothetical protein [Paenibacillus apiarius]
MIINREQVTSFLSHLHTKEFLFADEFRIQAYIEPASEVASYLISLDRRYVNTIMEGFLLLLERLEYIEEEWEWDKTLVEQNRISVLYKAVYYVVKNGLFAEISRQSAVEKINQMNTDIECEREITDDSSNVVIFDDWNLFQLLGSNQDNVYLYIWYTTA